MKENIIAKDILNRFKESLDVRKEELGKHKNNISMLNSLYGLISEDKVIELRGKEVWEDIKESPEYEVYIASEKEQIEEIKLEEGNILYINNPTKEMQLKAVKYFGANIEYIKNPSEEVQLQAVTKEGDNIKFIENPTDEVITEAIKTIDHNPDFRFILRHIENDSEETVKLSKLRDMTLDEIKDLLDN